MVVTLSTQAFIGDRFLHYAQANPLVTAGIAAVALSSLIGVGFLVRKLMRKKYSSLNKTIAIGKSQCVGSQCAISKNTVLKQIQVRNQFDDNYGYASCAYHALKNSILITNALVQGTTRLQKQVHDKQLIASLLSNKYVIGRWRSHALIHQDALQSIDNHEDAEWLRSDAIDALIATEMNDRILLHKDNHCGFNTIDDINVFNMDEGFDFITPVVREQLRNAREHKKSYMHVFIIGTMSHRSYATEQAHKGTLGHWFTVVLHQTAGGKREYIIADSLNIYRLQDELVRKLIAKIG